MVLFLYPLLLVTFLLQDFSRRPRHISATLTLEYNLRFRNTLPRLSAPHPRLYLATLRTPENTNASLTTEFTSAKSLIGLIKADVKAEKEGRREVNVRARLV
jgi:hypothetical protein